MANIGSDYHASSVEAILRISLFGSFCVTVDGLPIRRTRTRKGSWLLAMLALNRNRPLERGWIAENLWPDSCYEEALKNLRNSLCDLRDALGAASSRIQCPSPRSLQFSASTNEVDVLEFDCLVVSKSPDDLARAVNLYSGSLLQDCDQPWADRERLTRQDTFMRALEAIADHNRSAGMYREAAWYLRQCISTDTLRESAWRSLMECQAAAGDYASVTGTYRDLRQLLHKELNTNPAVETTELYELIRADARRIADAARPARQAARSEATHTDGIVLRTNMLSAPGNLPVASTSFIGRAADLEAIHGLYHNCRLVTLVGMGGCGKTRLALELAATVGELCADGACIIELASLASTMDVSREVARVLNVRIPAHESPGSTLATVLRPTQMLLILDNCEHLLESTSRLLKALLRECKSIRIVTTSREPIGAAGERVYRVSPLELPPPGSTPACAAETDSVKLFIARAGLAAPGFAPTETNTCEIAEICRQLEGIPLAIELAASQARALSLSDLKNSLADRFTILKSSDRTAPVRHKTLAGLLDWSFDQLSASERDLLTQLTVFRGGWNLHAAHGVCLASIGDRCGELGAHVRECTTSLADKSLINVELREHDVRYSMLDTVREYVSARYGNSLEYHATRRRHRDYYLEIAEAVSGDNHTEERTKWMVGLADNHENLLAALQFCLEDDSSDDLGLRLGVSLIGYWSNYDLADEGCTYLSRILAQHSSDRPSRLTAVALIGAGHFEAYSGRHRNAEQRYRAAHNMMVLLGDVAGEARALLGIGYVCAIETRYDEAREAYERCQLLYRDCGKQQAMATTMMNLGSIWIETGEAAKAVPLLDQANAIYREVGHLGGVGVCLLHASAVALAADQREYARQLAMESFDLLSIVGSRRDIARAHSYLGSASRALGDMETAAHEYCESLTIRAELRNSGAIAMSLDEIALLDIHLARYERAVRLLSASAALRRRTGTVVTPVWQTSLDEAVTALHLLMPREAFDRTLAEGSALSMDAAIALASR